MSCCCEEKENTIIRKQREEIILLTAELESQEEQLNDAHKKIQGLKKLLKEKEMRCNTLDKSAVCLNGEIKRLKAKQEHDKTEHDSMRNKILQKDSYIQTQANKLQQLQCLVDKNNQELENIKQVNKSLKNKNSQLQIKAKDQSIRLLELKQKHDELINTIEAKNKLLQISANQIQTLELNLRNLIRLTRKKECHEEKSEKKEKSTVDDSETKVSTLVNQSNEKSFKSEQATFIGSSSVKDAEVDSLLKSLQDTWLESNTKYEEIKNILMEKLNKNMNPTGDKCSQIADKSRIQTSTPVKF